MRRALLPSLLLLAACPRPTPYPTVPADAAAVSSPAWRTLTASHRVRVRVVHDGRSDERTLRGAVAIERPARLRLRALGPAGLTLFDLVVRDGRPTVVAALRGADAGPLHDVALSLAADLACAYALAPSPPDRGIRTEGDAVVVEEPGRRVRLSRFAGSPAVWRRAEIASGNYTVEVDVDSVEVDPALDPALFADEP